LTQKLSSGADRNIDTELDRLTCSAYLLTMDAGVALSVVMEALEDSLEGVGAGPNLLGRTVELSLEQLRRGPASAWDRKSSATEVVLYGDPKMAVSRWVLRLQEETSSNPVLGLDSTSRIAFVLHHLLGYKIREAATLAQISEKDYRAHLRNAYVQLVALQSGPEVLLPVLLAVCARA